MTTANVRYSLILLYIIIIYIFGELKELKTLLPKVEFNILVDE